MKVFLLSLFCFLSMGCQESIESVLSCPSNFIKVPSLPGYTQNDFCVAKYEMKESVSSGDGLGSKALSQAKTFPWIISYKGAITACEDMGKGYGLINNDEWQTLARNIELVGENWQGGYVGSKEGLNRGHSEHPYMFNGYLEASEDDDDSCVGTEGDCDGGLWHRLRRTHLLSNGEVIWDLAGNANEWVEDTYGERESFAQIRLLEEGESAKDRFGPSGDYEFFLDAEDNGGLGAFGITRTYPPIDDTMNFDQRYSEGFIMNDRNGPIPGVYLVSFRGGSFRSRESSSIFTIGFDMEAYSWHPFPALMRLIPLMNPHPVVNKEGFRCVYRGG